MRTNKTILEAIKAVDRETYDLLEDKEIALPAYKARKSALFDLLVLLDLEKEANK